MDNSTDITYGGTKGCDSISLVRDQLSSMHCPCRALYFVDLAYFDTATPGPFAATCNLQLSVKCQNGDAALILVHRDAVQPSLRMPESVGNRLGPLTKLQPSLG